METGPCSGASFLNMLPDTAARTLLAWLGRFAGTGPGFMSSRYAATTEPAISPVDRLWKVMPSADLLRDNAVREDFVFYRIGEKNDGNKQG